MKDGKLVTGKWPHVSEHVRVSDVARLIGVDRKTVSENVKRVRLGEDPRTSNPRVARAVEVLATSRESMPNALVGDLVAAGVVDLADTEGAPTGKGRQVKRIGDGDRNRKCELSKLGRLSVSTLAEIVIDSCERLAKRESKMRREILAAAASALSKKPRTEIPPLLASRLREEGFRFFKTLQAFLEEAKPTDVRLFLVEPGRKPRDASGARLRGVPVSWLRLLTQYQWARLYADAAGADDGEVEGGIVGGVTRKVEKKRKPRAF